MLEDFENFDGRSLTKINHTLSNCHTPEVKLQFLQGLRDVQLDLLENGQAGASRDYQWGTQTFRVYRCPRCSLVRKMGTTLTRHGFCDGCQKMQDDIAGARLRKNTLNHRSRRQPRLTSHKPRITNGKTYLLHHPFIQTTTSFNHYHRRPNAHLRAKLVQGSTGQFEDDLTLATDVFLDYQILLNQRSKVGSGGPNATPSANDGSHANWIQRSFRAVCRPGREPSTLEARGQKHSMMERTKDLALFCRLVRRARFSPRSSSIDSCASTNAYEEERKTIRGLGPWNTLSSSFSPSSDPPSTSKKNYGHSPTPLSSSKGLSRGRSWWNLRSPSKRRRNSNFSIGSDTSQSQSDISTPHGSPQLMRTISSTLMEPDASCRPGPPGWPSKTRELNSAQWDQIYEISLDLIECAWEGAFRGYGGSDSWSNTKKELLGRVLEGKKHVCVRIELPAQQEQREFHGHLTVSVQSSHRYDEFTLDATIPRVSWLEELPRKYDMPIWQPFLRPHRERNVKAALQDMMGRCTARRRFPSSEVFIGFQCETISSTNSSKTFTVDRRLL
ncbi:hypothetical protein FFLO_06928 [Filobasidium floriforme]|uniref:Uncharacterized protein n=1 Tax=Filobasidium floriforme TaxID=5210 RepID=A0A8K0JFA7_9TREE|nr:hypothetical protein FFLO_06928 [Filobasidium floriforme]